MQQADIDQFHQQLLTLRQKLFAALQSEVEVDVVELDQARMGRIARMDALQNQQIALDAKRRAEAKLQAVEGALRRIDGGSFGYCFVCDEPISIKRLEFDPTLTRCIQCTSARD